MSESALNFAEKHGEELLSYVLSVSRRMSGMRSLAPLLSYTIDEVLQLVGAERGYIVLVRENGDLDFRVKRDKEGNDLPRGTDEISHSILEEVVSTSSPLVLSNAMTDPRFGQAHSVMHLKLRSVMCVPLITQNETIGAIYVENRSVRGRFRKDDLPPLELMANQAAVAIENARLNDDLEIANQDLRELDELKNNFVMLVSHELRTPLTAVNAYANLMKSVIARTTSGPDTRVLETHQRLETAVERLNKTIQEIILVFRILSGQQDLRLSQTHPHTILEGTVARLKPICEERDLTLSVEKLRELPPLMLDGQQLKIVFENILGNAVKYTPDGGQIEISGAMHADGVEITVSDSGIGIPLAEQRRVFDLFHVLGSLLNHSSSKHAFRGGGLGLGLPIARGIVEAHQGTIVIESPGYDLDNPPGTTVRIFLPYTFEPVQPTAFPPV
jgi:signal transduction histidine kinase